MSSLQNQIDNYGFSDTLELIAEYASKLSAEATRKQSIEGYAYLAKELERVSSEFLKIYHSL